MKISRKALSPHCPSLSVAVSALAPALVSCWFFKPLAVLSFRFVWRLPVARWVVCSASCRP
eukprot:765906-Prorocentrum_minimum.AAC.1